ERAVARAAPGGVAVSGAAARVPGALAQTAPPDNDAARTGGVGLPATPLDGVVKVGALSGSVRARWSDAQGPCVGTAADAQVELASLSVLSAVPTLPDQVDLTGRVDAPALDAAGDQAVVDGLKRLVGPLRTLGGVLAGEGRARADGVGSLVSLPTGTGARSTVSLVDVGGAKAVRSTSTMRGGAIRLLAGTPFELAVNVVSAPVLEVTSTGDAQTSTVRYAAPVLDVTLAGRSLGRLDAAKPTMDVPIGVPLVGPAGSLPVIGGLLADGQPVPDGQRLDLGVIRLSIAQLNQRSAPMTQPFPGFRLGATARMLDVQVLPTAALGLRNLPSALAQVTIGEQAASAYAPAGGVRCGPPAGQPVQPPAPMPTMNLAYTTAQYKTIPIFWGGTAMLMAGVVLVAAFPIRRRPAPVAAPPEPGDPPGPGESAAVEGGEHGLDGDAGLDVELDGLPAGEDGLETPER
ncbi:hypothetical protein, partial [Actinophytocola sp.]|uniref:hypothetical protein n=1 Tax=Actinophytocola sp. TaxID=1872138 RepID=UPI002D7EBD43